MFGTGGGGFYCQGVMTPGGALLVTFTSFKLVIPDGIPSLLDEASRSGQAQNCGIRWRAPKRPSPTGLVPWERIFVLLTSHGSIISYHVFYKYSNLGELHSPYHPNLI